MGRSRNDPTHFETFVNDRALNALDTNWLFIDAGNAGTLTWGGTDLSSVISSGAMSAAYQRLTLPVNSGKGLVMSNLSKAAFH